MNHSPKKGITLIILLLIIPGLAFSQGRLENELPFEVNLVHPYLSISAGQLSRAQTLADLNWRYKTEWISEYRSVDIETIHRGKVKHTISKNDILTRAQKDAMRTADTGADIVVTVNYIPENTLAQKDPKELRFTFTIDPAKNAQFPDGQQEMDQYLREKVIDLIPTGYFRGFAMAAVTFTVNEEGEITDVQLFESSKDTSIDQLLLKAIREMPCWEPAEYGNGLRVGQELALTVGNMENCMVNLLNIRKNNF